MLLTQLPNITSHKFAVTRKPKATYSVAKVCHLAVLYWQSISAVELESDRDDLPSAKKGKKKKAKVNSFQGLSQGLSKRVPMDEASKSAGNGEPAEGAVPHQAEDGEDKSRDQAGDEPEGMVMAIKKGVKKFVTGRVRDQGDNTETSPQLSQHPAVQEKDNGDVYNFTFSRRGRAIIINNKNFRYCGERRGSEKDAEALQSVFKMLGFDVNDVKSNKYTDLTAKAMKEVLQKEAKEYNHADSDCLAVAILSHGDEERLKKVTSKDTIVRRDVIFGVDWEPVSTEYIMHIFKDENCPGLIGKPRLFFLQACRGEDFDDGVNIRVVHKKDKTDGDSTQPKAPAPASDAETTNAADNASSTGGDGVEQPDARPEPGDGGNKGDDTDARSKSVETGKTFEVSPAPIFKDYLVMYATTPGHYAWRRPESGSWFIESLHSVFTKQYTPHMSLTQALTRVSRMVAQGYEAKGTHAGKKEMPVIQSMLVRDVYFSQVGPC
ncbi:hypothetical protein BaRGS_00007260 [Batillaria attramentaria]|uniref:Caspase-3 n=1 Tax=Batillaria attramentaria TaxID=370345 RepID=A0ABD0LQF0_9CAEN